MIVETVGENVPGVGGAYTRTDTYTTSGEDTSCCCGPDGTCPPRLEELIAAMSNLDVAITCDPGCEADCFNDGFSPTFPCWPDTGTLLYPGSGSLWESTGLTCNVGSMAFECDGSGNMVLQFESSACVPVTIPTVITFSQNSPFMVVFTTSSHWFGYCDFDTDLGECGTEYEVTVTITEP